MIQCGCEKCANIGYYERIGIFEILDITDELKELIVEGASSIKLKTAALENIYKPLIVDGINKVLDGTTTLNEIDSKIILY